MPLTGKTWKDSAVFTEQITIRITKKMYDRLLTDAKHDNVSLSYLLRFIMRYYYIHAEGIDTVLFEKE